MPETGFVQVKRMFRAAARAAEIPLSDREAHRLAQHFILAHATEVAAMRNDPAGEEAVVNVLKSYLRKYGSLRAPRLVPA